MESNHGCPECTAVAFANGTVGNHARVVSNPFENDLSNRSDGRNRELWKSDTDPDKIKRYPMNEKPGKVV